MTRGVLLGVGVPPEENTNILLRRGCFLADLFRKIRKPGDGGENA